MFEPEQLHYVCHRNIGISKYDSSDDSMLCICASKNEDEWLQFTWQEAQEVRSATGWKIKKVNEDFV